MVSNRVLPGVRFVRTLAKLHQIGFEYAVIFYGQDTLATATIKLFSYASSMFGSSKLKGYKNMAELASEIENAQVSDVGPQRIYDSIQGRAWGTAGDKNIYNQLLATLDENTKNRDESIDMLKEVGLRLDDDNLPEGLVEIGERKERFGNISSQKNTRAKPGISRGAQESVGLPVVVEAKRCLDVAFLPPIPEENDGDD